MAYSTTTSAPNNSSHPTVTYASPYFSPAVSKRSSHLSSPSFASSTSPAPQCSNLMNQGSPSKAETKPGSPEGLSQEKWQKYLESKKSEDYRKVGFLDWKLYEKTINVQIVNKLIERKNTWEEIKKLPTSRDAYLSDSTNLKLLIRTGIPDYCRGIVWRILSGAHTFNQTDVGGYKESLNRAFGSRIPGQFLNIPTFGGSFAPFDHCLTNEGIRVAKRLLVVIAMENPHITYLPMIPDLVCLLLLFLSEEDTFAAVKLILTERNKMIHFRASKKAIRTWLHTFDDMVKKFVPEVSLKMKELKVQEHKFVEGWFLRFFVGVLPYQTVLRIFDSFLNEGNKILFRIGIALLKIKAPVLVKCTSEREFVNIFYNCAHMFLDSDYLIKKAFGFRMRRSEIHKYNRQNSPKVRLSIEPSTENIVYYHPKIEDKSEILSEEQFETFWVWLPSYVRIKDPHLLFSTSTGGYRLASMLEAVGKKHPLILIIKTRKGDIFGAFISSAFKFQKTYYGDRDCFLFTFVPRAEKFNWNEGCPDYFVLLENEKSLKIGGGGGYGISLDDELWKGRTESCLTFLNFPLTQDHKSNFEIVKLEVWGFASH